MLPPCAIVVAAVMAAGPACAHGQSDFYYFEGKPYHLTRSATDFVVGVSGDADADAVLRDVAPAARVGSPLGAGDRRFVVVTLGAGDGDMSAVMAAVRSRPGVFFVSPVYMQPGTQVRVIPTDELLARVKAGVAPDAVTAAIAAQGLRQADRLAGATDQYVLRLDPAHDGARDGDILRVARGLYETGLFEWVEPNFMQELRRGR